MVIAKQQEAITRSEFDRLFGSKEECAVAVFDRATRTGALRQKAGRNGCLGGPDTPERCHTARGLGAPLELTISPDGRNLYVPGRHRVAPNGVAGKFLVDVFRR